ncbi:MAG: hypothetical protein ACYDAE_07025 [Steroidobacteraceae bacterium]
MSEPTLYQICHRAQTHPEADAGFTLLDAATGERPDWGSYWPIRRFLLGTELDQEGYYGFFPANFGRITGLDATAVRGFIEQQGGAADVISFSPFFDQMALYLNILEQAIGNHPGGRDAIRECAALVAPEFRPDQDVTTSLDTIFRNCFVARPAFWAEWLQHCDRIFGHAEDSSTSFARTLTRAGGADAALKALAIEQVASLLLWSQPQWVVSACNAIGLPLSRAPIAALVSVPDFIVLDSLKIAYVRSGAEQYLGIFQQLRKKIVERHAASRAPRHG